MTPEQYFDAVQESIKKIVVEDYNVKQDVVEQFVQDMMCQQPGLQLKIKGIVENNLNSGISVDTTAQSLIDKYFNHPVVNNDNKISNLNQGVDDVPNKMDGDRGMNTMEKKVFNFKQFVTEKNKGCG